MFFKYLWLMCFYSTIRLSTTEYHVPDLLCAREEPGRVVTFTGLDEYKRSNISFYQKLKPFNGTYVRFIQRYFRTVPEKAFMRDTSRFITTLDLTNNAIVNIRDEAFRSLSCLRVLDLSQNEILELRREQFLDLIELVVLKLDFNNLHRLNHFTFKYVPNLFLLSISFNHIEVVEDLTFFSLELLQVLILRNNNIRKFGEFTFDSLVNLDYLDISENWLSSLDLYIFTKMFSIKTIELSDNDLSEIHFDGIERFYSTVLLLNLTSNSFSGFFDIAALRKYFNNDGFIVDLNDNDFYCSEITGLIDDSKLNKINLEPGRAFTAMHQVSNFSCDSLNYTRVKPIDYNKFTTTTITPLTTTRSAVHKSPPSHFHVTKVIDEHQAKVLNFRTNVNMLTIAIVLLSTYNVLILIDYLTDIRCFKKTLTVSPAVSEQSTEEISTPEEEEMMEAHL